MEEESHGEEKEEEIEIEDLKHASLLAQRYQDLRV
jgi:ferritin-like protein